MVCENCAITFFPHYLTFKTPTVFALNPYGVCPKPLGCFSKRHIAFMQIPYGVKHLWAKKRTYVRGPLNICSYPL